MYGTIFHISEIFNKKYPIISYRNFNLTAHYIRSHYNIVEKGNLNVQCPVHIKFFKTIVKLYENS